VEVTGNDGSLPRQRALALVNSEPHDGPPGVAGALQRLCRAMTRDLGLAGATVTLIPDVGTHSVTAASSEAIRRTEELQFDAGEGPTRHAYHTGQPVVVRSLASALARWPGYTAAALAMGVSSLVSLPLHVGASRFGALSLYWEHPPGPTHHVLRTALVYGDLATELLIDSSCSNAGGGLDPGLHSALETHGHIYQAQGMAMVDLAVGLPEALARMRAHAFATGQDLGSVARQILRGEPVLSRDPK
jgi:hypothetical protein